MLEFSDFIDAYMQCRKTKRGSSSALAFELDYEHNLWQLYNDILDGSYKISFSTTFVVEHPVKREIFAATFRDRVVHHLVMNVLIPKFEKEFIYDSYACRQGRGTLFGIKRIKSFIAQCSDGYTKDCYILKCDILGFFMNIDRDILWQKLKIFIAKCGFESNQCRSEEMDNVELNLFSGIENNESSSDTIFVNLVHQIVMNNPIDGCIVRSNRSKWNNLPSDKSLFGVNGVAMPNGYLKKKNNTMTSLKGIPIGNLTSQWFGNFYLNKFDHYMKHTLGIRYYGRYVDDFVIIHKDKLFLLDLVSKIRTFLQNELKLVLHPKKLYIQHYSKGVEFLGVVIKKGALLPGRRMKSGLYRSIHRYNINAEANRKISSDKLSNFRDTINSYWGLMRNHNSYRFRCRSAKLFSKYISKEIKYPCYCKINIKRKRIFKYKDFYLEK